jgi:hypothetical protein
MRVWECMYIGLYKAHAHSDCCEVMHACVGVCVWACACRALTDLFGRPCMYVSECVFGHVQGAWSRSYLRGDACMCGSVCISLYKMYAHSDCCEVMHAFGSYACMHDGWMIEEFSERL